MAQWPQFTWDPRVRQYRAANGRLVPRRAIRQALDEAIEAAKGRIAADARGLQAGALNLPEWQLRMEANLKAIHTMSAAAAAGGWAQATARDWAAAGRRLQKQYKWLEGFAYEIENGLPLDGRFLNRALSYAVAGSGTYEKVLRGIDLATGLVIQERRRLHSANPCTPCLGYAAKGWQPPGVLPDIGQDCLCGTRCQCTFERRTKAGEGRKRPEPGLPVPPVRRPSVAAQPAVPRQPFVPRPRVAVLPAAPPPVMPPPRAAPAIIPRPVVVPPPVPSWWRRLKQKSLSAARATLAKVRRFLVR